MDSTVGSNSFGTAPNVAWLPLQITANSQEFANFPGRLVSSSKVKMSVGENVHGRPFYAGLLVSSAYVAM